MSDVAAVGIIGAGAIGATVGERLLAGDVPGATLAGHLTRGREARRASRSFESVEELIAASAIVVEAAGHAAVAEHLEAVLAAGRTVVCVSCGALADGALRGRLLDAARAGSARLLVPSGAVGALDVVAAAARAGLEAVVVEQRKPPHTLLPPEEASSLRAPRVLFDGPVGDVVARYPTTTNVAAAVALAGIGFERTRALVVADPALQANRVVLRASGTAGTFRFELDNVASANPKTSGIVAYSVLGTIARLLDPLAVPA